MVREGAAHRVARRVGPNALQAGRMGVDAAQEGANDAGRFVRHDFLHRHQSSLCRAPPAAPSSAASPCDTAVTSARSARRSGHRMSRDRPGPASSRDLVRQTRQIMLLPPVGETPERRQEGRGLKPCLRDAGGILRLARYPAPQEIPLPPGPHGARMPPPGRPGQRPRTAGGSSGFCSCLRSRAATGLRRCRPCSNGKDCRDARPMRNMMPHPWKTRHVVRRDPGQSGCGRDRRPQ
jgi:hypothetical protein